MKDIAPSLFKKAKRKNISVKAALQNNKWIDHILPIFSPDEIREYVSLWEKVQHVQLDENREDDIVWRWTPDGEYTTQSAYRIQF